MTEHEEEEIKSSKKRKRFTLLEKKELIDKFKSEKLAYGNRKKQDDTKRVSCKRFCKANDIKNKVMLSDWLSMDSLGHLESWNGKNNLSKFNFVDSEVEVLELINEGLCNRVGDYIIIKKLWKLAKGYQYGAYAAQNISNETMIGFFSGEYCGGNDTYSKHKHGITKTHVIDAGNFVSCHARYVNKCSSPSKANVEFKVDDDETNIQEKIKLWTKTDIKKDEELVACSEYANVQLYSFIGYDKETSSKLSKSGEKNTDSSSSSSLTLTNK